MRVFSILPPAACYLMAAIAVFTTYYVYEGYFADQKDMQAALDSQVPATVPLDQFTGASNAFGEVAVLAQIRSDWMQTLSVQGESVPSVKTIHYLVAPDASALGTQALAAVTFPSHQVEDFNAWLDTIATEPSPLGQVYQLSGRVIDAPETAPALALLTENGIRASENFVMIEPFLYGRNAALAPAPLNYNGYVLGGIIALLFVFLGYQRSIADSSRKPRVTSTEVMSKLSPMATGMADPDLDLVAPRTVSKADPNSPLGRIQARAQSERLDV